MFTKRYFSPKNILITGASSGIGAALARYYAVTGIMLALSGRDKERLTAVAKDCEARGARVQVKVIDVKDRAAMAKWLKQVDSDTPLDLVIANAGISGGTGGLDLVEGAETPKQVREIFDINLTGVLNTIEPVLPLMARRGRGQIALMSSLASFSGWPGAPAYSASKGAVRLYGEALRGAVRDSGVKISVICPGFIKTPMTTVNDYDMPFMMPVEKAAATIARGLYRDKGRIAFPFRTFMLAGFAGILPHWVSLPILCKMPEKPSNTKV